MALSKDDLISGLRDGLRVKSYINDVTMSAGQMIEYIDKNIHDYGRDIQTRLMTVSKVGNNELSVGELVAWCDYHLNVTVPNVVRREAAIATAYYQSIRDASSGAIYVYRPGDRPIFRHVKSMDEYHFLASSRLAPPADAVIAAERNLVEFLHNELTNMAVDKSQIQLLAPPPPTTVEYTVVAGDTFSKIAAAHAITVDQLKALNPQVTDVNLINIGDKLKVPAPK